MTRLIHLNALQALEAALRCGTMKGAARELGISPAAVGQRVRSLEDYLQLQLLERRRDGVRPTAAAELAMRDLTQGFGALHRAADALNLDRQSGVVLRADPDWIDLWLRPRLPRFKQTHPTIELVVERSGAGNAELTVEFADDEDAETLYPDWMVAVSSKENCDRVLGAARPNRLEGFPLLHLVQDYGAVPEHGWPDWTQHYGHRVSGAERGTVYRTVVQALRSVDADVGVLLCPRSLIHERLQDGSLIQMFSTEEALPAHNAYRLRIHAETGSRRHVQTVADWIRREAQEMRNSLAVQRA